MAPNDRAQLVEEWCVVSVVDDFGATGMRKEPIVAHLRSMSHQRLAPGVPDGMIAEFREYLEDGLPQHRAAGLAVYTFDSGVPDQVPHLVVDDDYAFRRIFDNQLEKQPFSAQALLYLITLGDVPGGVAMMW